MTNNELRTLQKTVIKAITLNKKYVGSQMDAVNSIFDMAVVMNGGQVLRKVIHVDQEEDPIVMGRG